MTVLLQQTGSEALGTVAPLMFYGFAALTCVSALAVVLTQSIVRMATYLLLTLCGAAGLYFMLEAEFLAAVQLIVYAGGTLILIIFGVMLTSQNPFMQTRAKPIEMIVGGTLGIVVGAATVASVLLTPISQVSALRAPPGDDQIEAIGRALLSTYLVPFEVAAVVLLLVMIAAAYMARRRA